MRGIVPINIRAAHPHPFRRDRRALICLCRYLFDSRGMGMAPSSVCRCLSWPHRLSIVIIFGYRLFVDADCSVLFYLASHSLSRVIALATFVVSWQHHTALIAFVVSWQHCLIESLSPTSSELLVMVVPVWDRGKVICRVDLLMQLQVKANR